MANKLKIYVIIGSTRQNRFGDKPAKWIFEEAKKRDEFDAELLDLRDYPLPFFDEPVSPSAANGNYVSEAGKKWAEKVAQADGYIFVTPEYNHGYPAVLKNAIDYVYKEWNKKPVAFVSYGAVGGARSVEQLREVSVELQMAPLRNAIHLPIPVFLAVMNQKPGDTTNPYESLEEKKNVLLDELTWWADALKTAREK